MAYNHFVFFTLDDAIRRDIAVALFTAILTFLISILGPRILDWLRKQDIQSEKVSKEIRVLLAKSEQIREYWKSANYSAREREELIHHFITDLPQNVSRLKAESTTIRQGLDKFKKQLAILVVLTVLNSSVTGYFWMSNQRNIFLLAFSAILTLLF